MSAGAGDVPAVRTVRLTTVAECFQVEVAWVRRVYDAGLLGRGEPHGDDVAIAAAMLERVAELLRLQRLTDGELEWVALWSAPSARVAAEE